jgi:hypothetical protein
LTQSESEASGKLVSTSTDHSFFINCNMKTAVTIALLLATVKTVAGQSTLRLLIYKTDGAPTSTLEEQMVNIPGITATIIGQGTTIEGFSSKYEAAIPALRKMDADTLVVLSDSSDVLINHPWTSADNTDHSGITIGHKFIKAFQATTAKYPGAVVASAEAECCVGALTYAAPGDYFDEHGHRNKRACTSGHSPCLWNGDDKIIPWENFMMDLAFSKVVVYKDIFLNAGLIAGKAYDLLRVFETADVEVYEDAQAVLTDFMYRRPNEIILDYQQLLFGNNRFATKECMFEAVTSDKRLVHAETGATPLFIHSPGGYVSCHERLASRLGVELHSSAGERYLLQDRK